MPRRSATEIQAQFSALVSDWQNNPFPHLKSGSENGLATDFTSIDEHLATLASKWPDASHAISFREIQDYGVLALQLLLERYHREQGQYIAVAEWMVQALKSAAGADLTLSPFLLKPAGLTNVDKYVSDHSHRWIRAEACVSVALLVATAQSPLHVASKRVAGVLQNGGYKPSRGSDEANFKAVEAWTRKIFETSPGAWDARDAFTNFRQLHADENGRSADVLAHPRIGEKMLTHLAKTLMALTIKSKSNRNRTCRRTNA